MSSFNFLGNFSEILPYEKIISYIDTAEWKCECNTETELKKSTRPTEEQEQSLFYNRHNSSRFEVIVKNENFFPDEWFSLVGAKKENYQAKIYKTMPGNTEPPHIDYFPSFIGHTKEDGSLYTQEEILTLGKNIIRAWIPLENNKLGHLLFSPEEVIHHWKRGDVWEFIPGNIHGFVNAGREPRYVLVFTGWRV